MVGCVRRADTRSAIGHHHGQSEQSGHSGGQSGHTGGQSGHTGGQSGHSGGRSGQSGHRGGLSGQSGGQSGHSGGLSGHSDGKSGHSDGQSGQSGHSGGHSGQSGHSGGHFGHSDGQSGQSGHSGGHSGHSDGQSGQSGHSGGQSGQSGHSGGYSGQSGHSDGTSGQKYGQKFWKRGKFLLIFLLSLMSVRACRGGAPLGAQLVCARAAGLTERQRALCRAAPAAMAAVSDGLRMAYAECVWQMRGRRWNCSGVSDGKHFGHVISMATKEAAFTYAITSAGVTHALSAACARGDLPACGCNNRRRGGGGEQWEWGGARCGEAARGARLARRFLDARELEHDARALMNLHNNRLGRKAVQEQVSRECKCHGVSGSCGVRTCWRALPPFRRVAAALAARLPRARRVTAVERGTTLDGRVNLQLVVKKGRAARKSELVFLEASPPYCEPAPAAAALGTHRRHCNHTSRGEDGCENLCCGRGYSTLRAASRVQCRCSFQWCCKVRCDTCLVTTEHHICN